jgi:hypothetical protein
MTNAKQTFLVMDDMLLHIEQDGKGTHIIKTRTFIQISEWNWIRELNYALGLLNRKSEEIELLKVSLMTQLSRKAELDEELLRLQRYLKVANE